MADMKTLVLSVFVALLITVAFGATFIAMSGDESVGGYDVELSPGFKGAYMNATESSLLVGDMTGIGYNMTDSLQENKAKPFDDYFDIKQQTANLIKFPFIALDFVKAGVIYGATYLHIPPVVIGIILGIMVFTIIIIGAKIIGVDI